MDRAIEIRRLATTDSIAGFSCGEPALDRFFRHYARQNQFKLHLAVTCVAVLDAAVVGFATVAASSIERATLPSKRLRRRLPRYPLPVLRLARLGVDTRAQGLGIGRALLRHVLVLAVEQRERTGCVGVVTDAKAAAVAFYAGLGFVEVENVREGFVHGDPQPMFLAMGTIVSALEGYSG